MPAGQSLLVCTKEKRNSAQEYLRRADRGADRSAGGSQRPGMMKAAEKGSGPRVRGAHQDILGRPVLGDRSCVHEHDMVGDIAGEGRQLATVLTLLTTQIGGPME